MKIIGKTGKRTLNKKVLIIFNLTVSVIISTVLIVLYMPKGTGFTIPEDVYNHPWPKAPLISDFDFFVYKDPQTANKEVDSIRNNFRPYYTINKDIAKKNKEKFIKESAILSEEIENFDECEKHLLALLDTVYNCGIVQTSDTSNLLYKSKAGIRLIEGKESRVVESSRFFTEKTAYEYIVKNDKSISNAILQRFNINEYIQENLVFMESNSKKELENELGYIKNNPIKKIIANQKIVDRGEIVTEDILNILNQYKKLIEDNIDSAKLTQITIGHSLIVFLLLASLATFMLIFRYDYLYRMKTTILPFAMIVSFCLFTCFFIRHKILYIEVIPYALAPLLIRVFLDSRTAFMIHVIIVLIVSICVQDKELFILTQMVAGLIVIQSLRELRKRSQTVHTAVFVVIGYFIVYLSYTLINEGFGITETEDEINKKYIHYIINGIFLLFSYPSLWLLENIFGFTSDVTLVELSDTNNKLLRDLSEKAPGTFQHSIQVANLSWEVAKEINAHTQLVRTGALYHDIGKMLNPEYFTENQAPGTNPYQGKEPQECARIVINHVLNGEELASNHKLPAIVKNFITAHHGLGKTKFFYITYKNAHPDEEIDEKPFTYPGPNPKTKEEAIVMMSDSIEAASRSLTEYSEESINAFVEKIIDSQVADGFFRDTPLTFKDIEKAKKVFKERLKIIYHSRIVYPELIENNKQQDKTSSTEESNGTNEGNKGE